MTGITWSARGFTVVGTAAGMDVTQFRVTDLTGGTPEDRRAQVLEIVDALNQHGGPDLSPPQRAVLNAWRAHVDHFGYRPSLRAIAFKVGRHHSSVALHVKALEDMGLIPRLWRPAMSESRPDA